MSWTLIAALALGLAVGIFSGLIGVGGGIIIIPALVYLFRMEQHMAQGTSLAILLPPTGALAFMEYYRAGYIDWKLGMLIAVGVFFGAYFGAAWSQHIPASALRRVFAMVLVATAIKMLTEK